jgi:hypothetical protein
VEDILIELSKNENIRVWKSQVAMAKVGSRYLKFGVKGLPDITGIIRVRDRGIFLGIEAKTGKAVQSIQQKKFEQMIKKLGGFYMVARSVDDARDFCERLMQRERKNKTELFLL